MSIVQYTDSTTSAHNLQIWNNAAFDDAGGADGSATRSASWFPLQPISFNRSDSIPVHDSCKENRSPADKKSPVPVKPVKPAKVLFKLEENNGGKEEQVDHDGSIDAEIEEIEREIRRLSARLDSLRIKKAERDSKAVAEERRGRIVPARFMDPKQSSMKKAGASVLKKVEESPASGKFRRRGLSLGPSEISTTPLQSATSRRKSCVLKFPDIEEEEEKKSKLGLMASRSKKSLKSPAALKSVDFRRRGVSLGPAEIASATRIQGTKLRDIKEEKSVRKERTRSLSISPKSRVAASKLADLRKGVATVGWKKPVKREPGTLTTTLQPKKLFQEEKKPLQNKRPLKGRTVASRYSLITTRPGTRTPDSKRRKWSLPEKEKEENSDQERTVVDGKGEKPNVDENSPPSKSLRKIRTCRCVAETPRDSGPAKRVAELIGRRSHFDGGMESSCFQNLNFEEEME